MKLLLLGFQPRNAISYPHLKQVVDRLEPLGAVYGRFRERGYFLGERLGFRRRLRALPESLHTAWTIVFDSLGLLVARVRGDYRLVLAVDNFAYLVASALFDNVVLWSHDFLTDDEPRSRSWIQRWIKRRVGRALARNHAIIIQDRDRLQLFCKTYLDGVEPADVFFLPVSLLPCQAAGTAAGGPRPLLMQIGGINAWRSRSDELLADFQVNHDSYQLALHGFVEAGIASAIASATHKPLLSAQALPPDEVFRAVSRCDIGFIAYNASNLNFFMVARASGQLAEFLRCGKPVIAMGRSTLGDYLETARLGRSIQDFSQLAGAVREIHADLAGYGLRCRRAFDETYNLQRHLPALQAWLGTIEGR